MPLSKPFAIATEGPTIDGRNISRDWITQMAGSYDPKVYTAVANLEHYLSSLPDSVFGAYGKVVSLATRETEILGEKKLQLMAVVDANDALVAMQKAGKKAFCSVEVLNNFIGKGIAYLSGLAFTDSPASIGTESMKFSLSGAPGERYAFEDAVELQFETASDGKSPGDTLFAKIKALLGLEKKDSESRFSGIDQSIEVIALSQKDLLENFASIEQQMADIGAQVKLTKEAIEARATEFNELKEQLGNTDGDGKIRPPAAGGDGQIKTDC